MKKNILIFSFLVVCASCENKNNENKNETDKPAQKSEIKTEQISEKPIEQPIQIPKEDKKVVGKLKYICENFYKNGITEYLDLISYTKDGNEKIIHSDFYYYTSKNSNKIQLKIHSEKNITSGMEGGTQFKVSFPNEKGIYVLTAVPGSLYCKNPNGKTQDFSWDTNQE